MRGMIFINAFNNVYDFHLKITKGNTYIKNNLVEQDVFLFGRPFHEDKHVLISKFKNSNLNEFLTHESLNSIGNYLLIRVNKKQIELITSIGFSGGYIKNDDSLIESSIYLKKLLKKNNLSVDSNHIISYLKNAIQYMPSYTTPFKNIERLKPGCYLKFVNDEIVKNNTYIDYFNEKK
jgi:hypothetical protein